MTYKIFSLLLTFSVITCTTIKAQYTHKQNDSIRLQQNFRLKKDLNLTDQQFTLMVAIDSTHKIKADSLNSLSLSVEQRQQSLKNILLLYSQALQSCFSTEQWQQYQNKQQAAQQAFEERMKQKKIKYTLLQ